MTRSTGVFAMALFAVIAITRSPHVKSPERTMMSKIIAAIVAATFAMFTTGAFAADTAPEMPVAPEPNVTAPADAATPPLFQLGLRTT